MVLNCFNIDYLKQLSKGDLYPTNQSFDVEINDGTLI